MGMGRAASRARCRSGNCLRWFCSSKIVGRPAMAGAAPAAMAPSASAATSAPLMNEGVATRFLIQAKVPHWG